MFGKIIMVLIILVLIIAIITIIKAIFSKVYSTITIYEYEQGVKFHKGKFIEIVGPGKYTYFNSVARLEVFDMRQSVVQINGQELLCADNVNVKISLAVKYQITDPKALISQYEDYHSYLYMTIQFKLREVISDLEMDEILANRKMIADRVKKFIVRRPFVIWTIDPFG